jgi:hypothetical protein
MSRLALGCAVFLLAFCAKAAEVQIPGTSLWFTAPDGFTELSQKELDVKFPSKTGPRHAIGNERRTTTVAYDTRDVAVTEQILEQQIDDINSTIGRAIPGFVSVARGMRALNGKNWAYFEMTSTAIDADIHNIVLMTAYEGRMVVLNFNSTKADFVAMEPLLRSSISSLALRK